MTLGSTPVALHDRWGARCIEIFGRGIGPGLTVEILLLPLAVGFVRRFDVVFGTRAAGGLIRWQGVSGGRTALS